MPQTLKHARTCRRRTLLPAAALTLGLTLAACGGHASNTARTDDRSTNGPSVSASSSASLTASPSGSSRAQVADAQAITAYLGMWQDFTTAGQTSDWQSATLSAHATGDALLQMSRGLYADHLNGLITKGQPVDHPTVKSASPLTDPTTVLISDCGDSSHWLKYDATTGQPAPGSPGGRQAITAEVKTQADGSWRVDQFAVEAVGTC